MDIYQQEAVSIFSACETSLDGPKHNPLFAELFYQLYLGPFSNC